jgi:oligoribonuclease NrnB/cAMP/cGMP phosphodiesterase (DHH superfamily)
MNKAPIILFHALCSDGMCSAWVARKRYPNAEFRPMHYDSTVDLSELADRLVIVLDMSFPRAVVESVHGVAKQFVLLDHHASAESKLGDLPYCIFAKERSGAGLTWRTLFAGSSWLGEPPALVQYVEDRDLWKFSLDRAREVAAAIQELPIGLPGEPLDFDAWDKAARLDIDSLALAGTHHLQTVGRLAAQIERQAQLSTLADIPCLVASSPVLVSEVGHLLAQRMPPMGVVYSQRADGTYTYSLRSTSDFDVSTVAAKFGGGGHRNAAGFTSRTPMHVCRL